MKQVSRRSKKIAQQIKNEISWLIDRKLKDPAKGFITITYVKLSADMKLAYIYYTVLGEEDSRANTQEVLNRSVSFLRNELKGKLNLRFLPELRFFYDDTFDYSQKISNLISKIHDEDNQ